MTEFSRELIFGKRPIRRTDRKPGESEWYYLDPRGASTFSDMKKIDVPTENTPNPYANEIQNYLYKNDEYNYRELYGDTPPPVPQPSTQPATQPTAQENKGFGFQSNNGQTAFTNTSSNTFGQQSNTFGTNTSFGKNNIVQPEIPKLYDNNLSATQRENAMKNGEKLYLHIDDNPQENGNWKFWCDMNKGREVVNTYNNMVEKYANKYNVDTDLVKAIMFSENACGHYYGVNELMDYLKVSKSQTPMNIRGDIWSDFQGKHYDTYNPEQNIELSVRLIKQIYDSLDNPTPAKVITLWNSAGKNKISSFGYRGENAYKNKSWLKEK